MVEQSNSRQPHNAAVSNLDWARIDATNHAFHWFINTYGGNIEAAELNVRYFGLSEGLMNRQGRDKAFASRVLSEHHAMLDCFRKRDPEAAARISAQHVKGTLAWVQEAFETVIGR
jgi:DNA-binding GntR family transcriptional regulator